MLTSSAYINRVALSNAALLKKLFTRRSKATTAPRGIIKSINF